MSLATRKIFDRFAVAFLIIQLLFLLFSWKNYPTELDTPYHLLMGKMFAEKFQIPVWDDYEFAPMGRPHLYPPLQHLLIWFLRALTHLDFMDIGRLIVVFQTMFALFSVWFLARKFFNPAAALFALVFFASNTEMWWWQTSVAPIAIITAIYPVFIYLFYKKKRLWPSVILAACLYLHYGMAMIMVATALIAVFSFAGRTKEYIKNFFVITGSAAVLFLPWVVRIFAYRDYFFNRSVNVNTLDLVSLRIAFHEIFLNLNLLVWVFALPAAVYCYKRRRTDFKYTLLLSAFMTCFSFVFLFQGVRFNAHTPVITSVLAGLGCYLLLRRTTRIRTPLVRLLARIPILVSLLAGVFFELHYLTPRILKLNRFNIAYMGLKKEEVFFRQTPLSNEIMALASEKPLKGKHAIRVQHFFTEKDTCDLLEYIKKYIPEDTILHVYNGALADYITLVTGRKTDWGMFFEMIPPELMNLISRNVREGCYVSTDPEFKELLPPDYVREAKFPHIIQKIGKFYIGRI